MFSLICARTNCWVNNREAGDLRRHRAQWDVILMQTLTWRRVFSWNVSSWKTRHNYPKQSISSLLMTWWHMATGCSPDIYSVPLEYFDLSTRKVVKEINTLQWRHNERHDVSNHRRLDCLLNLRFRRSSKKTSKLRVTDLFEGISPVTGRFPSQRPVTRRMFPFGDAIMTISGRH